MQRGKLVYVMGASGVGKDTLLAFARAHLDGGPVLFAHRYITRAAATGGEAHVPVGAGEFARRLDAGLFALHWDSHGLRYGIGVEIDRWLAAGLCAVVNGSREALDRARARYPDLCPVLITASPEAVRQRLQARGRESGADIAERLARAALTVDGADVVRIANDGPPDEGGARLVALLTRLAGGAS